MRTLKWRSLAYIPFHLFFFTFFTYNRPVTSDGLLDVCKLVYCGKGTCELSPKELFGFECNCNSGWKKLIIPVNLSLLATDTIEFPPCVIPNCTFDFQCSNGSLPLPKLPTPPLNLTDPCLFSLCGDGTCVKDDATGFRCQCNEGSANLLHDPKMTCIKKCALGVGCSGIDLGSAPQTPPPPPENSASPPTGLGEMLSWSRELHLLTMMIFAAIFLKWI